MNSEGYKDTTAEKAVSRSEHVPKYIWDPIKLTRQMLSLIGLDLTCIEVQERKTKRKYGWRR